MRTVFEWEQPLVELEEKIQELRSFIYKQGIDFSEELTELERKADKLRKSIYERLTPWQRVRMARHSGRPTTLDYIKLVFDDFIELHGDRVFGEDQAIIGGIAVFDQEPVTVIGPQKGKDTKENIVRNFGLPHPEGYRKALRLMKQAEHFRRPIITLVDVVGAYPGIEAEQRGQGLVIAECIEQMSFLKVPIICVITGEGGSGGALAIGVGDRILMFEHAWYSVISPEMCATILWKDVERASEAAELLRLTPTDLLKFGIIDDIITEPLGGAHRDYEGIGRQLKAFLRRYLSEIRKIPIDLLVEQRLQRYRNIGQFEDKQFVDLKIIESDSCESDDQGGDNNE